MFRLLLLVCCTWGLAVSQGNFDYFYDYDAPLEPQAPQPVARGPPPPPQQVARRPAPRQRPQAARPPPSVQQATRGDPLLDEVTRPPVPILKDSRRIDTNTGAFVYEYAGADGSEKYEVRYPNGTVIGNYSFINDLGEKETRFYTAGDKDSLIDETTDPNYVDLGNYDLYKHLEQPYVHQDGTSSFDERPRQIAQQPSRPRAQQRPRPAPRRPAPPPPPPQAPVAAPQAPLDINDGAAFFSQPNPGASVFDYEDVAVQAPLPPAAPVPVAPPVPVAQPPPRRRRPVAPAPSRNQGQHRFDFSSQTADSILDSLISRFN